MALLCVIWLALPALRSASAHGGEDHGDAGAAQPVAAAAGTSAVAVRSAERNVPTTQGQFKVRLRQSPPDPRAGEEVQFAAALSEQVEGGFGGGGGTLPLEEAKVSARVTTAAGGAVAANLPTHGEGTPAAYGVHYAFRDAGEYKLFFDVRTSDGRQFAADFPVSVARAPVNWAFWLGLAILTLIAGGAIFGYHASWRRDGLDRRPAARKTLPVAVAALLCVALGTVALAYFEPPRERRAVAALPPSNVEAQIAGVGGAGDPALGGAGATITISKESQSLFGIRLALVATRRIVSGLKVTGTVRARPDARAVVAPPVSGRVSFNRGITVGAVVGRGEQIGTIEQILGAPEQANLEAQRTALRTAALEQQAKQAEQNALAQQARTRLTQARRELQRAANLLEVGAAPKKRVEEAQTAVRLAEQEVASAEAQALVAAQQVTLARESVGRVNPVRTFPLLAPVTGTVVEVRAVSGQQVEAGAELLNVVNLSSVLLEARVFEQDLQAARDSRRATYTAAGVPGEVYRIGEGGDGRLVTIGATVEPQTRTVPIVYEVPNPLNRLRDGMFVELTLDTSGGADVLGVPKAAVVTEQGRTFVYVFAGGERFEKRVVVLGAEGQDFYEIKSGVQAGERVVVEGIYQLRSTQPGA